MEGLTAEGSSSSSEYYPCIVCFKNVFGHHHNVLEPNLKLLQLFIKLLERMSLSPLMFPKEVGLCNDCAVIVEPVTKLYHQIQCLQLHLDWNLDKVRRVMVLADMTPSTLREFQEMYRAKQMMTKDMRQLRCAIKNKLKLRNTTSFPTVVLHDYAISTSPSRGKSGDHFNYTSSKVQIEQSIFQTEENLDDYKTQFGKLNFALGWVVSFITLCTMSSKEGIESVNPAFESEREMCDDETADDDYLSMEVDQSPEETLSEHAGATVPELITQFTVIPTQSVSVQLEKLNLTKPISLSQPFNDAKVEDFKMGFVGKNPLNANDSGTQEQGSNINVENEKRLLRRQYKCSCLMTFSTLLRLECHKKTCGMEVDNDNDTGSEGNAINSVDEETIVENENVIFKFEINETESSSVDDSQSSSDDSDNEENTKVDKTELERLEANGTFECLPCNKSYNVEGVENKKFKQFHKAYMHSNGQTLLDQSPIMLLQIAGADVKLDATNFTSQICSYSECKSLIFADADSFEYHKSLHGAFKCNVCEFECNFAVQLAIHETEHSSKIRENNSCPRCPFKRNADYIYINHFLGAHLSLKARQTKCGVCAKTFFDLNIPLKHFVNEHDVSRLENISSIFICSYKGCNAYFLKEYQLFRHKKTHLRKHKIKTKVLDKHGRYRCVDCSIQFARRSMFKAHRSFFHKKEKGRISRNSKITPNGMTIDDIVNKPNATYFCSVGKCEEKFMTETELETHSKLHGKFPCHFCPKVFEFAPDLPLHEKSQECLKTSEKKNETQFNCSRCEYKTNFRKKYVHHHLETHLGLVPDQIKCPICNLSFFQCDKDNIKNSILRHWNVCHNPASLNSGQCFINCDMCSAFFATGLQLDSHKTKVHKQVLNESDVSMNKRSHMCPIPTCKKYFESEVHLKNHRPTHAKNGVGAGPVKVYKCKRCATVIKTSNYNAVILSHSRYKHSKGQLVVSMSTIQTLNLAAAEVKLADFFSKQNCPHEGCERKIFVTHSSLNFHQSLHGNFTCNTCDYKCNFAIDLITHELGHSAASGSHTGQMTCSRCEMIPKDIYRHFLQSHLNIDTTEGSKCDICQASFTDVEVPFIHFVNEHDLNRLDDVKSLYKCDEDRSNCRAYFLTDVQRQVHIEGVHKCDDKNRASMKLKCNQCLKTFRSHIILRKHQVFCLQQNSDYNSIKITSDGITMGDLVNKTNAKHICSVDGCNKAFFTKEEHSEHSKLHGRFSCSLCPVEQVFAPDLSIHALEHITQGSTSSTKRYSCCLCEFSTLYKLKYVEHYLETHMGLTADLLRCPICRQGFYGESDLKRKNLFYHYSIMHDLALLEPGASSVKCDTCPAYFLNDIQLYQHKANIHGDKNNRNTCKDCHKIFQEYTLLANHREKVHLVDSNDYEFICDLDNCERKFEFKIGLEWHKVLIHTKGIATLKCPHCEKVYRQKSSFDLHVKNHDKEQVSTGRKKTSPVVCEQCGKVFKYEAHLQTHKLRHVGPDGWEFVCEICSRKFANKYILEHHMRTHTKEKPFVCDVCGEKYAHRHNWRHHMKNKHNINIVARKVDSTNMKSTRKGKKLVKHAPIPESSESDLKKYFIGDK